MNYSYRDIYPTMGVEETSTEAIPTPTEQKALQEDEKVSQAASPKTASAKKIGLAVLLLGCVVVVLGSRK